MEHNDDLILYLAVHVAEYELTGTVGLATCISAAPLKNNLAILELYWTSLKFFFESHKDQIRNKTSLEYPKNI